MENPGLYILWVNGPDGMGFLRKESTVSEEEEWVLTLNRLEATRWNEYNVKKTEKRLSSQPAFAEDSFLPVEL